MRGGCEKSFGMRCVRGLKGVDDIEYVGSTAHLELRLLISKLPRKS